MTKLNQIIAVEKGIRNRADKAISDLYKLIQKPDLFAGLARTYRPKDDDGDVYPSENMLVQQTAQDTLNKFSKEFAKIADIVLTKEMGNQQARATVKFGDEEYNLPVTYLLFLEKWLGDVYVFVNKLPVLEPSESWTYDVEAGIYKNETQETKKTKKVERVLTLFQPTDKHPGQAKTYPEDVLEGYWSTTKLSGKMSQPEKTAILDRVNSAIEQIKKAREEANGLTVESQEGVGMRILDALL
jgi:hypothetical protein